MYETIRDDHEVLRAPSTVRRAAMVSVHTCPLDQPGTGDSGGMNVSIRQVARRLAEMGVEVDIFTRASSGRGSWIGEVDQGVRVIHLEAGPDQPIPKADLPEHLCAFLYAMLRFEADEAARLGVDGPLYDVIHSHYWLSGWVGRHARERWSVPLFHTFHTLGRVKNLTLAPGDTPEPPVRLANEERIVHTADCVLAPTEHEAHELVHLYGADPSAVSVVSPGVDTAVFRPGTKNVGKDGVLILFVGRLQPLKAPDIAVRALAALDRRAPALRARLVVLGGPSGSAGTSPDALGRLATELGIADRIELHPPVPQTELAAWYRAADLVVVPSRSESFGLVALEAAACGTPVVATDVGGLRTTVRDGVTGLLVPGADAGAYADAMHGILTEPGLARAMGEAGARFATRFDWRNAAAGLLDAYEQRVATARV
ncbi:MAG TPA: D-inositol-3-phosphate glycosyltransferase [Actinomycetota bacterium]